MKVVITGGAGFIGFRLAQRLLELGALTGPSGGPEPIDALVLFDTGAPAARLEKPGTDVTAVVGDIADRETVFGLVDRDDISVFHLASVVSGGGEKDFDLAMRVNLDGGRHVFEALRARKSLPRVVFASSIAVFGGAILPPSVGDEVKQTPQSTYGVTKAICELLINDYSRKGYLDGRSARLPTVIIRPGKPNAAASSFVSGVFREPLNGEDFVLPVSPDTAMPLLGYRAVVEGLVRLHEADGADLGADRAVNFPCHRVTVQDMIDALRRVAGNRHLGAITVEPDPFIEEIVKAWPQGADFDRATALGLPRERGLDEIVAYYMEDYLPDR